MYSCYRCKSVPLPNPDDNIPTPAAIFVYNVAFVSALWQPTLKKLRTLKIFLKYVKFGTESTQFEIFFSKYLNLEPTLRTLKNLKIFKVR